MKTHSNVEVRKTVERNGRLYSALRRSDIAMQFRQFMVSKGIRNVDLAERLGVSEANVSRWLKGNQNLSLDTLYQLSDALEEVLTLHLGEQVEPFQQVVAEGSEREWVLADEPVGGNVVSMLRYREALPHRSKAVKFAPAKSQLSEEVDSCAEAAA